MSLMCPICGSNAPDDESYAHHLAEVHGLVDDPGAPATPSVALPPTAPFAPVDSPPPPPPSLPPPPAFPLTSAPGRTSLPPPPPPSPAGEATVPKAVVGLILGAIVVVLLLAMTLTGRSDDGTEAATVDAPSSTPRSSSTTTTTSSSAVGPVFAESSSPTDSVDPAEARIVAEQLWNGFTTALSDGDTAGLRAYEAGPLLESDIGVLCRVGCPPPVFAPLDSIAVNVPHQTGWPASFLATVITSGCGREPGKCVYLFAASQAAAEEPWKATLLVSYSGTAKSEVPQLLPDGFAVTPPDPVSAGVPELLQSYADYRSARRATGQGPTETRLLDGPFTSGDTTVRYESPDSQRRRGVAHSTTYRVDPSDPIHTFATGGGSTTACGTIRYHAVLTSADGSPLDASASIQEWGLPLPPGSYSSMAVEGLWMVCFTQQPPGAAEVDVTAVWGGNTGVSGVPS